MPAPSQDGKIYVYTTPAYRDTRWKGKRKGRGLVKVGYTVRDPHKRIREQIGASSPEKEPYKLLMTAKAVGRRGKPFTDKDVHRRLRDMGCRNVHNEWFEARPEDVRKALRTIGSRSIKRGTTPKRSFSKKKGSGLGLWGIAAIAVLCVLAWREPALVLAITQDALQDGIALTGELIRKIS